MLTIPLIIRIIVTYSKLSFRIDYSDKAVGYGWIWLDVAVLCVRMTAEMEEISYRSGDRTACIPSHPTGSRPIFDSRLDIPHDTTFQSDLASYERCNNFINHRISEKKKTII